MNGDHPEFACCAIPELPDDLRLSAACHAAFVRPENGPGLVALSYDHPEDEPLPPESITLLRSKFWPNGSVIRVAFRGGSPEVNAKVLRFANLWGQYANISFVPCPAGQVRDVIVAYDLPGYWSYLGTDCSLLARRGQVTMNLQGFDSGRMPESEWYRVVCHEVGHAIGAVHEQMRREVIARIDEAKCIRYFEETQRWPPDMTRAQVLTPIGDLSGYLASPVEETSIMEYQLPGSIMKDGRPVIGGSRITARDGQYMAKAYPGRGRLHPQVAALMASADPGVC
jgi:hypothetical protein